MKKSNIKYLLIFICFLVLIVIQTNCSDKSEDLRQPCETAITPVDEFGLLTEYLGKQGNIINRRKDDFFIEANVLYKLLDKNILIIDIRDISDFNSGHIKNAIHMDTKKLYYYFNEKWHPYKYDKIVLVCYSGQSAAFDAAVLQLLGFDNVCSLKWGMCSWDKETASKKWLKKINNSAVNLSNELADVNKTNKLPDLNTGKIHGQEILEARAIKMLVGGYSNASINLDKISDSDSYFFIQYSPKNSYQIRHPEGVKLYQSFNSLTCTDELKTLPTDKTIVVLSEFGQDGAMITAYLKLLGYQVKNLNYGIQNYMHSKLEFINGQFFHQGLIKNYPLEKVELKMAAPKAKDEGGC